MRSLSTTTLKVFLFALLWSCFSHAGEWVADEQKLLALNTKIQALEHEINELIESKNHSENPAQVKVILDDMVKKHAELVQAATEQSELVNHMRFEHPEKGEQKDKDFSYSRYVPKTLQEMQKNAGLDGRLDELKHLVEYKYHVKSKEKLPASQSGNVRKPASLDTEEAPPERIHLSE